MPKHKISKAYTLYSFHIPALLILAALVVGTMGDSYKALSLQGSVLSKKSENKPEKPTKSDKNSNPGNDSTEHKKNVDTVVENLGKVAEIEKKRGNVEVSTEVEEVNDDIDGENSVETVEIIDELESRPQWQNILLGTDYKNLGQLRSQIVRNENSIRKLTNSLEKLGTDADVDLVTAQIRTMEQEQERLMGIVQENESQFSVLGWVFKLLNGYTDTNDGDSPETTESSETTTTE